MADRVSPNDPVYLEPLGAEHDTGSFCSRAAYLDWSLSHRALADQKNDLTRTIVAVNDSTLEGAPGSKRIEGFVALEAGTMPTATVLSADGSARFAESQISNIYIVCLARDVRRRGHGYGDILLMGALRRAHLASFHIGVAGVFLYSLQEGASLYLRHGFEPLSDDPKRLFLPMSTIRRLFHNAPALPPFAKTTKE